jgi:hypothetical protein
MTVQRIWKQHGLQPHRVETFKLSRDPYFVEKLRDVVGLYLDPPDKALVLSVDEKSQIQALDRTAPLLPLRPGIPARQTHDYKRHGTTTLFAALSLLDGKVIGECLPRQRSRECIPDEQFMAQHGGALVWGAHPEAHPPWHVPQCEGADRRHHRLPPDVQ